MKKFLSVIMIFTFALLIGCSGKISNNPLNSNNGTNNNNTNVGKPNDNAATNLDKISDYYPLLANVKYEYEGEGNEYASYVQYVDYINGNKIQLRINNGGSETVNVIENSSGELKLIYAVNEYYYRENFLNKTNNKAEILLKEPLKKGTSWTLPDGSKRSITNMELSMNTPLGTYKCIEVTTKYKNSTRLDYYAKNTGLLKTVNKASDYEVSSSLKKISKNTPFTQTIKFYYPNINDNKLHTFDIKLSFNTNDITRKKLEELFRKAPNKTVGKLISENTKINSLYLNKDNMVYLDFSKELVSQMNAGSGYEVMILQSITNTLGHYYNVNKVYITVDGNPYSSGHIIIKKGEAFIVK